MEPKKVHDHIDKYTPPVPILSQLDPVHSHIPQFLKILYVVLVSTSVSPKWNRSLRIP